jgi:uncharacterized membrane protein HdeD (DUF308 family)
LIQTLIKNWWLLAICGLLHATNSLTNFFMEGPDGSLTLRTFALRGTVLNIGMLALAAGACTIAAGIWHSSKGRSWLLVVNGAALAALGLILRFWTGRLALRTIALLFVVMALSIGILQLATALRLRRHLAEEWFLGLAGAVSVGFALAFFGLAFRWIKPERPESIFLWLSSYFGFSAICMLAVSLRLNSVRAAIHRMAASPLPAG